MADNQLREQERREARRKRRIRNQILVYMTLIILILVAALGVVSGVKWLAGMQRDAKEEQEDSQAKIEEIFSDEPDIQIPEPTPTPVPELTPEELQVFKEAVQPVRKKFMEKYGEEACTAFQIE